jgi:probable O-glycosylation ligase (exosortase A-associated)
MTMIAIALTYSRGALVGLFLVLAIVAFRSKYRIVAAGVLALLLLIGFAVAPEKWTSRMNTMRTGEAEQDESVTTRYDAWRFARLLAADYPVTGGGFETFSRVLYNKYIGPEHFNFGPHSNYFQMLAEHGYPGLLLYLMLIGSCFYTCWRVKRWSRRHDPENWLGQFSDMTSASLLAYAASGAFLGFAYFDLFYQMVGTTIILGNLARQEMTAARAAPVIEMAEDRDDVPVPATLGRALMSSRVKEPSAE